MFLPGAFIAVLTLYFALTMPIRSISSGCYTADVLTLSVLYMLRVLAGAVAIQVSLSSWLLGFCIFLFISLAYLKRFIELRKMDDIGRKGHGPRIFRQRHRYDVRAWGRQLHRVGLVFALFINSPEVHRNIWAASLLWIICLV